MSKGSLYLFAAIAMVAGWLWVVFNFLNPHEAQTPNVCFIRNITGIPCPSCGSTHSVIKLLHLNWKGAIYDNPLGFIIVAALLIIPFWLLYDTVCRKPTFYNFYKSSEIHLRKWWVAIPLIVLVVANWMWCIYKYKA